MYGLIASKVTEFVANLPLVVQYLIMALVVLLFVLMLFVPFLVLSNHEKLSKMKKAQKKLQDEVDELKRMSDAQLDALDIVLDMLEGKKPDNNPSEKNSKAPRQ